MIDAFTSLPLDTQLSYSSVYLELFFNEHKLGFATGFTVCNSLDRSVLITNRHVVTGRDNFTNQPLNKLGAVPNRLLVWRVALSEPAQIGRISHEVRLYDMADDPRWVEHPSLGARVDAVGIALDEIDGITDFWAPLHLRSRAVPRHTHPVSVIGFPFGKSAEGSAIWCNGSIASSFFGSYDGLPCFLIDCRSRTGQSGSPVYFYSLGGVGHEGGLLLGGGQPICVFLGVYSGRIHSESDLGMVWRFDVVEEILKATVGERRVPKPPGI